MDEVGRACMCVHDEDMHMREGSKHPGKHAEDVHGCEGR